MKTIAAVVAVLVLLVACSPAPVQLPPAPTPTEEPPTPVAIPPTLEPTATAMATKPPTPTRLPTQTLIPTRTPTPLPSPTEPASTRYQPAFGIAHGQPAKYLAQGEQSRLSDPEASSPVKAPTQSIEHLAQIFSWLHKRSTPWSAGGATIGKATSEELFTSRKMGRCHDWALLYAPIVRQLGYPAVIVDTASIDWAWRFQTGAITARDPHQRHVFVEVYVAGQWVLTDPTNGWYMKTNYNPAGPVIPLKGNTASPERAETFGFYVMRKGVDIQLPAFLENL